MYATLRLFKALPIEGKNSDVNNRIINQTIPQGFIFGQEVMGNYSEERLIELAAMANEVLGFSAVEMNNTFHKSWTKVRDANMIQLVIEQMIHYFTTYGFEAFEMEYDPTSVFVPAEKLEIPELDLKGFSLTFIRGYTQEEFKQKIKNLLASGVALGRETVNDIVEIALWTRFTPTEVEEIKNKEVYALLAEMMGLVPRNPNVFMRGLLLKATGKALIIKNPGTIKAIKDKGLEPKETVKFFNEYVNAHGLKPLASIFYRYKPLFLAFRSFEELRPTINKIRRLAVKYHKPMPQDLLNNLTGMVKRKESISAENFFSALENVNVFRKVRAAQALNFRMSNADSILYRIRNGKGFATEFDASAFDTRRCQELKEELLASIAKTMAMKVEGKNIYIPENINYTLPATEKQFTGNFPSGTSVSVPSDIIFGIHWTDVKENRIDLDLSLIDLVGTKYGWNGLYRSGKRTTNLILFSGDVTAAPKPNGATELFYVSKPVEEEMYMMYVNYFNYNADLPVPFGIVVASEELGEKIKQNYMIDPNKVIAKSKSEIGCKQELLGFLTATPEECRFYFFETELGKTIAAGGKAKYTQYARRYMAEYCKNALSLNTTLQAAGANIVNTLEEADIDLSPTTIERDTIIGLLS